jgi:glycosyltransferase involved in cell wall biosynthesis
MTERAAPRPNLAWTQSRPHVSVICIFLNAERYIAEAIDSVLAQDFADLELLLVDDGSAPPCSSIARDYAAEYAPFVRYLEHPGHENRGMSASRNLGIAGAQGEYIAFIDADDVWAPHKLREQLAVMQAHPELGLVCGAVRYWRSWQGGQDAVRSTGHVQDRVVQPPAATLALYPLGKAAAPCPSDLLLRRAVVEQVGGFEAHFTGPRQLYEDQAFLAKLYLTAPVYFSSQVWLDYRQRADSCVSEVTGSGRYHEVRAYFLRWFRAYLAQRSGVSPRVWAALSRALWPYEYPRAYAAWRTGYRVAARVRRVVRGARHYARQARSGP